MGCSTRLISTIGWDRTKLVRQPWKNKAFYLSPPLLALVEINQKQSRTKQKLIFEITIVEQTEMNRRNNYCRTLHLPRDWHFSKKSHDKKNCKYNAVLELLQQKQLFWMERLILNVKRKKILCPTIFRHCRQPFLFFLLAKNFNQYLLYQRPLFVNCYKILNSLFFSHKILNLYSS